MLALLLTLACSGAKSHPDDSAAPDSQADSADDSAADDSGSDDSAPDDSGPDERPQQSLGPEDAAWILQGEVEGGHLGEALDVLDFDGDGALDLVVGAFQVEGAEVLLFTGPLRADLVSGDARASWGNAEYYSQVSTLCAAGDLDGDGLDELAVGDSFWTYRVGTAYLLQGDASAQGAHDLNSAAQRAWTAGYAAFAGSGLEALGDLDGDGHDDLAVGAPGWGSGLYAAGTVFLIQGRADGQYGELLEDAQPRIEGTRMETSIGLQGQLAGELDLDGDGQLELAIASRIEGVTWLFSDLSGFPALTLDDADAELSGAVRWIAAEGDADGDGYDELLHVDEEAEGHLRVLRGGATPWSGRLDAEAEAWLTLSGPDEGSRVGRGVDLGDADADGQPDLLVGAYGDSSAGEDAGAAWLFLGPLQGGQRLREDAQVLIDGAPGDKLGVDLLLSDLDQDGRDELILGAWFADGGLGQVRAYTPAL
ncbi:MAG: FG-GAP repeat protein [Alphaproteobacteria bacterium]|nr:FG-GAP repeat protein [Alphaproteobacteria bacterium]